VEEGQGGCRPKSGEENGGGWKRSGQRASEAQGAPAGGLGKGRGWSEGVFPRRPRWRPARGFPARRRAKLELDSCRRMRGSYWSS
jgi:hypothetical protein